MTTTFSPARRGVDFLRALAAAALLVLFVIGAPIALIALAPIYLPDTVPTLGELGHALTSPDDGSILFAILAVIGWVAWAMFTVSVVIEVVAGIRRVTAPSIPLLGSVQHAASGLLATAALLIAVTWTSANASPASAAATSVVTGHRAGDDAAMTAPALRAMTPSSAHAQPTSDDATMTTGTAQPMTTVPLLPTVIVQRGDTLWDLAERHLGAGTRFTEIRDLNLGRPQPDGHVLQDADWIYPGWTLHLPPDATGTQIEPPPVTAEPETSAEVAGTVVVVQPGDSLWSIAAHHLGDGERFTELAALNIGQPQPDGATMTDPDKIQPGWTIALPGAATTGVAGSAHVIVPPLPETPAPASNEPPAAPTPPAHAEPDPVTSPRPTEHETTGSSGAEHRHTGAQHADDGTSIPLFFAGFTALAAAGVIGEITRRRHLQRRARRAGESIPLPEPGSPEAQTERTLRSAATPVTIPAIQLTLANLGSRCYRAERDLPRLAALTLDERQMTLHLLDDDPDAVPPFTCGSTRTWIASTSDIAAELPIEDSDRCVPYPALVTLGHTDDATMIINLEAAGTLSIIGDDEHADAVLRAIIIELATSDLSGQLCVEADEPLETLEGAFDFVRLHTTDKPGPGRARHTELVADVIADTGVDDTLQARSDRVLEDTWMPVIYVEHELADAAPAMPWSSSILLTRTPVDNAWTLELDADGHARLAPLGIALRPQRLTVDQLDEMRSLLITSLPPSLDAAHHRGPTSTAADLAAMAQSQPRDVGSPDDESEPSLRINVLGPIQIDGLANPRSPLSPRMQELLVYLSLHGPATGPALDEVLWNGTRVAATTRNALLYRTRGRVGEDVLPRLEGEATFRLGPDATTDWRQFQQLVAQALDADGDDRVAALESALSLVRDRPFLGIAGSEYTWADHDIQQMISRIADAAHVLSRLHTEAGRHRDAVQAATHGLLVEPYSEQLQQDAIRATEACSGGQEARKLRDRFTDQLMRLDPELSA